jgi:hypothetical protein
MSGERAGLRFVQHRPYYTKEALDEYVEANTSAPARSGVEHTKNGNRSGARQPEMAEAASVG